MSPDKPLHICLIAGEPSGDVLGGRLIKALHEQHSHIVISGVGGVSMAAEGLQSLFPMEELSVMGLAEILPRIPQILKRIKQTASHVQEQKPDIVITIDSPDFSFRVARKIKEQQGKLPKMIHYVAPTVWAWRPERAAKLAHLYDGILCLFPFEPPYFEKEGMKAAFVGHSMMETLTPSSNTKAVRKRLGAAEQAKLMGVFFGSRRGELKRMGPILRQAALDFSKKNRDVFIIAPTLPHLENSVRELLKDIHGRKEVITDPEFKKDTFKALDYAVATSGTIGLELAVANVPHIIGYKTNRLTWALVKPKLTIKYAHLANILMDKEGIADRMIIPEFIQEECTAENMTRALQGLNIAEQKVAFSNVRTLLYGTEKDKLPSEQAASFILNMI